MMRQLYEKLQKGGKARAACAGWILYWGITLGLLLFEKERIIGTTEEEKRIYLPVFAVLVILCFGGWLLTMARFARMPEKKRKPRLVNIKMLLPVLLNAVYLFFELEYKLIFFIPFNHFKKWIKKIFSKQNNLYFLF